MSMAVAEPVPNSVPRIEVGDLVVLPFHGAIERSRCGEEADDDAGIVDVAGDGARGERGARRCGRTGRGADAARA